MQPDRAAAHNSLGWALQEEGRLAEAAEHYREALRLDPNLGGAQLNIGGVHEELGELAEAEAAFRAALRIQPRYAAAHARLATLLRGKLPDGDRGALKQRLADARVAGEPRAQLLFAWPIFLTRAATMPAPPKLSARPTPWPWTKLAGAIAITTPPSIPSLSTI